MSDQTTETEITLLKQVQKQLEDKIDQVDRNCDERSKHTDAKLDDLQKYLITTMGGLLITLLVYLVTHA